MDGKTAILHPPSPLQEMDGQRPPYLKRQMTVISLLASGFLLAAKQEVGPETQLARRLPGQ